MVSRRKWRAGQSTVEMAIAAPVLVVLLLAVADFARVSYAAMEVASAARAGVQYGAQSYVTAIDLTGMQNAAITDGKDVQGLTAAASDFCMCNGAVVACSPPACSEPQNFVQVTTKATFNTVLSYPGIPSPVNLSSTAVMEVQ
jgi:Flp pilus assembly protein TadG